jgi:hypothetical protein
MLENIDFSAGEWLSAKVLSFGVVGAECELKDPFNCIYMLSL